ncbi:competence protein CoiA family protein [Bradyrhizobium glycinis]|uniref:competence protein CoiA family protein n=1 Tax=Bradyrhizobium glycinis TaxID=2751812 RepID=UPI0018D6E327|nr:hypothetical protein [Bradyrhizobium glycinis]
MENEIRSGYGQRFEAYSAGRGTCPVCTGEVIAKCGSYRVSHWAHRGIRDCDSWAERETEWHRAWKNTSRPIFKNIFSMTSKPVSAI